MRTERETIRRPRTCVVNHKIAASSHALAYVGPAFGMSNLAAHLGTRCAAGRVPPAAEPQRPAALRPKWHWHRITLGTGVQGMSLTIRHYGMTGAMSLGVDLGRGTPRDRSPVSFEISGGTEVWVIDDVDTLCIGDSEIVLKPRALALAIRWLEQRGIEVRHTEFFPF